MTQAKKEKTNSLAHIGIVTRYELLKHLRRRRVHAVLIITLLIGLLTIVVPLALRVSFPQQEKEWASAFFAVSSFLIIIAGTFFAGDAIASEFEHKTGYIIFTNPVKRASLVTGKFLAALISALLTIGVYYVIGAGAMLGIYGTVPVEVAASLAYSILYLCCVLGFTFLFSALLKGSMGATLLSFFMFLLIFSGVSSAITLAGVEPWFIPTYASGMITQVISPQKDYVQTIQGLKIYAFFPKFPISIIVLVVYFVATLALSILITRRKQMA